MKSTMSSPDSAADRASRRAQVLKNHLLHHPTSALPTIGSNSCLSYFPPELNERIDFDTREMRRLLDGHNVEDRDWLFGLMMQSKEFNPRERGGKVFVSTDYNQSMEQIRETTMERIKVLVERGVFEGWLMRMDAEAEMRKFALFECLKVYDHSLAVKSGVHFLLWGTALQLLGTKRHHDKWLKDTETYAIKGCFAMTELGHGSNVRGVETVAIYDSQTEEFVINTPCESAQKYWIGGAANSATHTIVFAQLHINESNQGVHALIVQIRDADGNTLPNIRIADCGHKIGLNGVDNGRIWFDNVRTPRDNLLNAVADVSPDGQYLSAIKDPDQRFAAFLAPLTSGRVVIAASAIYSSKVGLAIAVRYALSRRAFSISLNGPEVLLLDYPSHQRRLLPLLAKTYAMSFAANHLKTIYWRRTPESNKTIHVVSSAFKAIMSWHNMRTLQECREACGGQGLKTENRIGVLKGEKDVQSTFEGDNNVLLQQVSKALLVEYTTARKRKLPFKSLGLEHMNGPSPVVPSQLSSATLQSSEFQMSVFCLRERDLLKKFAEEVAERQANGESREMALILSFQLAEDLAKAFSDRTVLQTFVEAEANVASGPLKDVLGLLRSMYALICLEEDSAFLRYGYISTDNAAAIRKEVTRLCSQLRPHAFALVSSLGIPDAFLGPIAFDWISANSWSACS